MFTFVKKNVIPREKWNVSNAGVTWIKEIYMYIYSSFAPSLNTENLTFKQLDYKQTVKTHLRTGANKDYPGKKFYYPNISGLSNWLKRNFPERF